jgi:hypothetical protein
VVGAAACVLARRRQQQEQVRAAAAQRGGPVARAPAAEPHPRAAPAQRLKRGRQLGGRVAREGHDKLGRAREEVDRGGLAEAEAGPGGGQEGEARLGAGAEVDVAARRGAHGVGRRGRKRRVAAERGQRAVEVLREGVERVARAAAPPWGGVVRATARKGWRATRRRCAACAASPAPGAQRGGSGPRAPRGGGAPRRGARSEYMAR